MLWMRESYAIFIKSEKCSQYSLKSHANADVHFETRLIWVNCMHWWSRLRWVGLSTSSHQGLLLQRNCLSLMPATRCSWLMLVPSSPRATCPSFNKPTSVLCMHIWIESICKSGKIGKEALAHLMPRMLPKNSKNGKDALAYLMPRMLPKNSRNDKDALAYLMPRMLPSGTP